MEKIDRKNSVSYLDLFDVVDELIEYNEMLAESVANLIKLTEKQQKEIEKLKKV